MVDISRATTGVNLPPDVSGEIWGNTVEQSVVMQASRRINLPGAGTNISIVTGEPTAAWVGETAEKAVSRATLDNKTITPYKLAVIEPFSNEFRRDLPGLYAELARRLPFALAKAFDSTVFGVTAAPGSNFDRLNTAPQMTVDSTGTYGDLVAVYQAIATAGGDLSHWLASPSLQGTLLGSTDSSGRPLFVANPTDSNVVGSMFGRPILSTRAAMITSTTVGDDTGIAGDFANSAVYGTVEGVQIAISDQATLNDGGTALNLWQRNMFAVRAEIEVGFRVRNVNHFVRITDAVVDTP